MRIVLALTFFGSFLASVVVVLIVRKVAVRIGFVDHPGGRKHHAGATPLGGGVAIVLGACLPVLGAALVSWFWQRGGSPFPVESLRQDIARAAGMAPLVLKLILGGLAMAALGLWDDLRPFSPKWKLVGQFIIAIAVACTPQMRITLFIHTAWVQVAVTAVWIVLMANCFNLLDNMDGQSGLLAFLTGATLLVLALQTGQSFIAGLLVSLLGAVLGFLLFNFPPASIFMGDMGSMFVGYMLAMATTLSTYVTREAVHPFFPVLVPLVIFAVPLYDALSVIAIRFHTGAPLLEGDRSHISHRLMRLGMSDRMVLLTVGLMVLATSPGATIPYGSAAWRVLVPALQALAVILVIVQLELVSVRGRGPQEP